MTTTRTTAVPAEIEARDRIIIALDLSAADDAWRIVDELGLDARVRRVDVPDAETAVEQRFLGSPTVRVNGRDVEPGAEQRADYALCCRVYRTRAGLTGEPDERWLRDALLGSA